MDESGQGTKLTAHPHLMLQLRMCGAVFPLSVRLRDTKMYKLTFYFEIHMLCYLHFLENSTISDLVKGKSFPIQAWSGPEGSRKLRSPDFMTLAQEGGKVVSLTHRPHLPPENSPGTHFCQRLSRPQRHSAIGRIMSMKNNNDTIWDRTSDLPICTTAPQPLCRHSPLSDSVHKI